MNDPRGEITEICPECGETIYLSRGDMRHWNTGEIECAPEPIEWKCTQCGHVETTLEAYEICEKCESEIIFNNCEI